MTRSAGDARRSSADTAVDLPADHPFVTDDMRRTVGAWGAWSPWSPVVTESDIRRWAIATYWPEPPPRRYWDAAFAATTPSGGIVAPDEFNPFAWAIGPTAATTPDAAGRVGSARPDPTTYRRRVNGGIAVHYGSAIRPGDRIRRRVRLRNWQSKRGRDADLLLVGYEHEWRNDADDLVRLTTFTLIYS